MIPLIGFVMAASEPSGFPDMKFKDWRVACDNVLKCRAGTATPEPDQSKNYGPDGPNSTSIFLDRGGDAGSSVVVNIEQFGQRAVRIGWDGDRDGIALSASDESSLSPVDSRKLLDAIKRGQLITLLDIRGRKIGVISLAGASAALLWMDDKQHRIGTTTALIRPGSKSSTSIPNAPSLPVVHAAQPSTKKPLTLSYR